MSLRDEESSVQPRKERLEWVKPVVSTIDAGSAELQVGTRDDTPDKTS